MKFLDFRLNLSVLFIKESSSTFNFCTSYKIFIFSIFTSGELLSSQIYVSYEECEDGRLVLSGHIFSLLPQLTMRHLLIINLIKIIWIISNLVATYPDTLLKRYHKSRIELWFLSQFSNLSKSMCWVLDMS